MSPYLPSTLLFLLVIVIIFEVTVVVETALILDVELLFIVSMIKTYARAVKQ